MVFFKCLMNQHCRLHKKKRRMLPKRLKWRFYYGALCYQNVWNTLIYTLTSCYITASYKLCMLPKRLVVFNSFDRMLPKRLIYVTKTFGLCYQNVWIMLPKRLKWSCNLLILSIVLRSIILIILSNFIIFIIFQGKKDCFFDDL